ncbi:DUF397 domain-containing protein [Nocardiopsis exhalans]|uniref:DUF397 domain-containing protein n=1 Tax=Nocardiopsis exhalans TaxID=163604 RepID=A0ABY5DDC6_9ACTN|nr:DUF397 domain-containing protein [Nocardiopsis exhalans]USY21086.1 DUF397 domain-containing protein [Nocardiopsis exhalans]
MDMTTAQWRKSSYRNPGGPQCVKVAELRGMAAVRDTQNRELGHLTFQSTELSHLLSTLQH